MIMQTELQQHILIVEDETTIGVMLKEHLKMSGFTSRLCKDGEEGWETVKKERFDLIILDVNMPKKNGFELATLIREHDKKIPIIFVTANSSESDKVKGFNIGGDEYITKPFSPAELIARMNAIFRRIKAMSEEPIIAETKLQIGNCDIDLENHLMNCNGIEKRISTTESELLKLFIKKKNKLIPRNEILLAVWGRDDYYTARNLDVYINKLRKLIKEDSSLEIVNIHGSGFKLVENS
jgi:DNA-binding response OmpR family regulator